MDVKVTLVCSIARFIISGAPMATRGPCPCRGVLADLMATGVPAWLYDGTDYVASFAPFNNVPTQYRVSVEGQQRWFAQCGFEALAVCWLFPGKDVIIEAPCLDCGEAQRVVVREGRIVSAEPATILANLVDDNKIEPVADPSHVSIRALERGHRHRRQVPSAISKAPDGTFVHGRDLT